MKSLFKMTLIGGAVIFALAGCDDKTTDANTQNTPTQTPTQIEVTPSAEAYAIGSSFGAYLKGDLERNKITLDSAQIVKGFEDTFNGESKYNEQEVQSILTELNTRLQREAKERFDTAKAASVEAGDAFRAEFALQEGVKQTESGLLYQILEEGSDTHPTADDTVIVHYVGTLVDGSKFDSSYDRGETTSFPLNGVIKGWTEGIQLIGVGGKIKLVVPPELAYGDQETPAFGDNAGIPPASTLVFEVELFGIDGENQEEQSSNVN